MRVFVIGSTPRKVQEEDPRAAERLRSACTTIGEQLARAGHDLVLCSPFEDAADFHVLRGAEGLIGTVHFYFPDVATVRKRVEDVAPAATLHPSPPPTAETREGFRYAWLLAQLSALDASNLVIAIGGDEAGPSSLLLALARQRRTPILPFGFLGGSSLSTLQAVRYELEDKLGSETVQLLWQEKGVERCADATMQLVVPLAAGAPSPQSRVFFISYARARPYEADIVETMLRRRDLLVHRDESVFGAGHDLPASIRENIARADVFIALWCREYACSPWCFDELDQALERQARGKVALWILRLDDTRIVPPGARDLVNFSTPSREALQGKLIDLIEPKLPQIVNTSKIGHTGGGAPT